MTFSKEEAQVALGIWFAPWVEELGLVVEECREGYVRVRHPFDPRFTRKVGAMSGQAIMAAFDTVMVLAAQTAIEERRIVTTVSQSTNFLRAIGDVDTIYEVEITKIGRNLVFGSAKAYEAGNPDRVAATAMITNALLGELVIR